MSGNRPRIKNKMEDAVVVKDEMEYVENRSSKNARRVDEGFKRIKIGLWADKHYAVRYQHGDEGGRREGIDLDCVKALVNEAIHHLLYYCSKIKGFTFVTNETNVERATRVVLQREEKDGIMLNIVIETHSMEIDHFEITIITAMKINGFDLSDGQYIIQIYEDGSKLKRFVKGNIQEISEL
jgi:hypothetical protein